MALVDHKGSFVQPWRVWFHQQLQLARNYMTLQDKAKKLLTIADVDMTLPYFVGQSLTTRSRPSAAEFMAHITIEVTTNLDLAAEARSRPRGSTRPAAQEFVKDEDCVPGHRANDAAQAEDGAPAGPGGDQEVQAEELTKQTQPFAPIPDADVQKVVFYSEVGVAAKLREYRNSFHDGFGRNEHPGWARTSTVANKDYEDYAQCDNYDDAKQK